MSDYTIKLGDLVAQGELRIESIESLPEGLDLAPFSDPRHEDQHVLSHSERGSHHLLTSEGVEVLERRDAPEGVRVLYAIVRNPEGARLYQNAGDAHGAYHLPAGVYEIGRDREYDPMREQARRVAD